MGRVARRSRCGLRVVGIDLLSLPLADASVGSALSVYSAQFFELAGFLAEIRRVLVTGGAVLAVLPRRGPSHRRPNMSLRFRAFQQVKNLASGVGQRVGRLHLYEPDEIRGALAERGFTVGDSHATNRDLAVLARA